MSDLVGSALELVEAGASMQEAEFYDAAMTGEGEPAMLPLEESPWRPIYEEAARWIPSSAAVTDLGAGTGRFAAQLRKFGHRGAYLGLDFSPASVQEARSYMYGADCDFAVVDLRDWNPDPAIGRQIFTCLEVLEHLEEDYELIRRLPPEARLIFSVPSYMSASHLRCFPRLSDIFERYAPILELRRWTLVDFGAGNYVHVCDSTRRSAGW